MKTSPTSSISVRRRRSISSRLRARSAAPWGLLTGQVTPATQFGEGDIRASLPRFEGEALEANLAFVDLVTEVAERKNATVGQVALAWLLAQKPWIVPIPGTRRLERLDENLGSVDLDLTLEDLAELDNATVSVQVQGDRYPEALLRMIDR
jgi:aryl-alcohol dehydrogenase-like predicted oxidoreductase